jgi:hypothetical protein
MPRSDLQPASTTTLLYSSPPSPNNSGSWHNLEADIQGTQNEIEAPISCDLPTDSTLVSPAARSADRNANAIAHNISMGKLAPLKDARYHAQMIMTKEMLQWNDTFPAH